MNYLPFRIAIFILAVLLVVYIGYEISNVYLYFVCKSNFDLFKEQFSQNATGDFCNDLIRSLAGDQSNVVFNECPNLYWHDGKELVLALTWNNQRLILKGRNIFEKEMLIPDHEAFLTDQIKYQIAFERLLNATFIGKLDIDPGQLLPWGHTFFNSAIMSSNLTALRTAWLLAQDNEYVLSKSLAGKFIFPEVKSTCNHFYLVESAERILDLTYIIPSVHLVTRPYARGPDEKLDVAIKLLEFVVRLEDEKTGLELCDVKFDHFGFYRNESILLMIDSDMIFNQDVTNESIVATPSCLHDRDCDFIDCEGLCLNGKCKYDANDNNLKRICRNMLFMSILDFSPLATMHLGLLPDFEFLGYTNEMQKLKTICTTNFTHQNDLRYSASKMLNILKSIKLSLYSS